MVFPGYRRGSKAGHSWRYGREERRAGPPLRLSRWRKRPQTPGREQPREPCDSQPGASDLRPRLRELNHAIRLSEGVRVAPRRLRSAGSPANTRVLTTVSDPQPYGRTGLCQALTFVPMVTAAAGNEFPIYNMVV